jgi:arabinose-5-phosphate isomerase
MNRIEGFKDVIRETFTVEADALRAQAEGDLTPMVAAIELMFACKGKVIVTGLGKSGHISRKIAATLSSTGTPAMFLHPAEALHGDFGAIQPEDTLLAIAQSGETFEVLEVVKFAKRLGCAIVAITGKPESGLGTLAEVVISSKVQREACPLNLAPTASSTLALAIGDALAVGLMSARGFKSEKFAALHPGGRLGRRLALVKDYMHPKESVPVVGTEASFREIVAAIASRNFGIVAIVDRDSALVGCVTDGDVRRAILNKEDKAFKLQAKDFMSGKPKTVRSDDLVLNAVELMEAVPKCTVLFCLDSGSPIPAGVIRMHDILQAKIL